MRRPAPLAGLVLALVCALLSSTTLAAVSDRSTDSGRFRVAGALTKLATSEDGRFAVQAELRHAPEAHTADQRFTLKTVNLPEGGCDPLGEDLFSNGFENP